MRRLRKAAAVVMLGILFALPCRARAANSPSELSKLFQEAFSSPFAPGKGEAIIQGISYYKGVILAMVPERFEMWIYIGGSWTVIKRSSIFEIAPGHYFTIFESSCAPLGFEEFDILGGFIDFGYSPSSSNSLELSRIIGGNPPFSQIKNRSWDGTPWANAVGSLGCVLAVAEQVPGPKYNLLLFVPDDRFPGKVPMIDEGFTQPAASLPLTNGVDGILDGKINSADDWIGGMELQQNENGALTLIVAMYYNLYLLEFESGETVVTTIPLRNVP